MSMERLRAIVDNAAVSAAELTEFELAAARMADVLYVREDHFGFVPRHWLEDLRRRHSEVSP